ncbi:Bromodomain-containing protein [Cryomyces antarcticus]
MLEQLKVAKDKNGRIISTPFLTLPDQTQLPEYYQHIVLPIAIDTMEAKLRRGEYPNLTTLESDAKRMVTNAKSYNNKDSLIFADAERIRKAVSNFMVKSNPAYMDPRYTAFPTPLPVNGSNGVYKTESSPENSTETPGRPRRTAAPASTSQSIPPRIQSVARGSAAAEESNGDFTGKTFQQAQEQIMNELIKYREDGVEIFVPFVNLPSRSLLDYYRLIKKPVSLSSVRKRVRGQDGRNQPTGVSHFKSWDAMEEEISFIWRNAREYNEDGSDIFNLAGELEQHFKQLLAEAKTKVQEPPQPRLKINMSAAKPSIKLRLGGNRGSPPNGTPSAARNSHTAGVTVDNEALMRQKQHVHAGVNGQQSTPADMSAQRPRNPFGGQPRSGSDIPTLGPASLQPSTSAASRSPPLDPSAVKKETPSVNNAPQPGQRPDTARQTSSSSAAAPSPHAPTSAMLPPPSVAPRIPSGSPYPAQAYNPTPIQPYHAPAQAPLDTKYRTSANPASAALMPSLTLSTHPQLKIPSASHFSLTIPASKTMTQQSLTVTLPSTHYFMRIVPEVSKSLGSAEYRVFVSVNGMRLVSVPQVSGADVKKPLYEASLLTAVNRIEVEVVAAAKGGGVEIERCVVFISLMKD